MSCSYLITGDVSVTVTSRRWNDVSFRQRLFPQRQLLRQQSLASLTRCVRLVATVHDNFSNQSLVTRNCFASDLIGDNGGSNGNNDNRNGNGGDGGWWFNGDGDNSDDSSFRLRFLWFLILVLSCLSAASAIAKTQDSDSNGDTEKDTVWEVRGSKRKRLVPDFIRDEFISEESAFVLSPENLLVQCRNLLTQFLLPEGFPNSVTSDYLDYSLWRGVQGIASQISGVLATQVR